MRISEHTDLWENHNLSVAAMIVDRLGEKLVPFDIEECTLGKIVAPDH